MGVIILLSVVGRGGGDPVSWHVWGPGMDGVPGGKGVEVEAELNAPLQGDGGEGQLRVAMAGCTGHPQCKSRCITPPGRGGGGGWEPGAEACQGNDQHFLSFMVGWGKGHAAWCWMLVAMVLSRGGEG